MSALPVMNTSSEGHKCSGSMEASATPVALSGLPFPQELVDEIISYFLNDKPTLMACSVVCHSWRPTAASHLFRRLHWSPRTHDWPALPHVERRTLRYNQIYAERVASCVDELSRSPYVRDAARELVFSSLYSGWASSRPEIHDLETVTIVLDMLPHLHTVELVDCNIRASLAVSSVLSSTLRSLKTLRIRHLNSKFVTCLLPVVLRLLAQFAHITEVIIQGELSAPPGATKVPSSTPRTRVHELSLIPPRQDGYAQLHRVLNGLASRIDMDALERFTCRYNWTSRATALVARAPALTTLTYAPTSVPLCLHPPARLRALTALVTLSSLYGAHRRIGGRLLSDLDALCLDELEELCIVLSGRRARRARPWHAAPLPDDVVRREYVEDLCALLGRADWAALGAVAGRCLRLRRLRVQVVMRLSGGDHRLFDGHCLRRDVESLVEEGMCRRARASLVILDVVVRVQKA